MATRGNLTTLDPPKREDPDRRRLRPRPHPPCGSLAVARPPSPCFAIAPHVLPPVTVLGSGPVALVHALFSARHRPVVLAAWRPAPTSPIGPALGAESVPAPLLTLLLELGVHPGELDVEELHRQRLVAWEAAEVKRRPARASAHVERLGAAGGTLAPGRRLSGIRVEKPDASDRRRAPRRAPRSSTPGGEPRVDAGVGSARRGPGSRRPTARPVAASTGRSTWRARRTGTASASAPPGRSRWAGWRPDRRPAARTHCRPGCGRPAPTGCSTA